MEGGVALAVETSVPPSPAGDEGNVAADLGDAGLAQILHQHVAVVANRPVPGVELIEGIGEIPAHVFNAEATARLREPLLEPKVADSLLLEHVEAVGSGHLDHRGIKGELTKPAVPAEEVDLGQQGAAVGRDPD